jgi:annexin A7/11
MKRFGTDEKAPIHILANKDPYQIAMIRQVYHQRHKRNLETDVASEVSGHFEDGLLAIIRGPLQQDVYLLHHAMAGLGTKESVLDDVLLGRSNADMAAIKRAYQATYHQPLENVVRGDLSMQTERHFMMVLAGNRAEDSAPVIPQQIDQDVLELYKATEGKVGTDELLVCSILSSRNDAQIRAIALAYEAKFRRSLETVIKKARSSLSFPEYILTYSRNFLAIWSTHFCTKSVLGWTASCATQYYLKTLWLEQVRKTTY